jgi:hypothetical protein
MRYGAQTTVPTDAMEDRVFSDAYDGAILEQAYHNSPSLDRHKVFHSAFTYDGTEVEKNKSFTPSVIRFDNMPPGIACATCSGASRWSASSLLMSITTMSTSALSLNK